MKRFALLVLFFLFIFVRGVSQIKLGSLTIAHLGIYEIQGSDILVVDTLILHDSARLVLNNSKKDNFIHAKKIIVGRGCTVVGKGENGKIGEVGTSGTSLGGPCRDGTDGQPGTAGKHGKDAVNLFLYFDELVISGNLYIDLTGGDGGDGGKGGTGGDGNPGTRLCQGGNGGNGGSGANGGNGGNGGTLTLTSKYGADLRTWVGSKIFIRQFGGFAGIPGEGGLGGQRGLSSAKDGNQGQKGPTATEGVPGKPGGTFFERR